MAREKDTRTREQRRAEIIAALANPEFAGKTNDELGAICNVHEKTIRNVKRELAAKANIKPLDLSAITLDDALQMRVSMNEAAIAEYAEAMKDGAKFPALKVISDGATNWLVDGWHRYKAAKLAGLTSFDCDVQAGDFKAARIAAYGANAANNALQRTKADKRKAVVAALADPDLKDKPNTKIAAACGVTEGLVRKIKGELVHTSRDELAGTRTYEGTCDGDNRANPLQQPALASKKQRAEKSEPDVSELVHTSRELIPASEQDEPECTSRLTMLELRLSELKAEIRRLEAELAAKDARISELEASQRPALAN